MSKRLEAAVKAWDHHWGDRYGDEALEEMGEEVQVALDAADAVMFSDEALFKVESIHHIHGNQCLCGFSSFVSRDRTKHIMEVTIAALKEAAA